MENTIKEGTRLYLNITNKCTTKCEFCCMYSGPDKNRFLDFDVFKNIIDKTKGNFELQLEGGEPLLHKSIFLFMEYAMSTNRCKKIIILTNGFLLNNLKNNFLNFANYHKVELEFKISINYWLINEWKKTHSESFIEYLSKLAFCFKYHPLIHIIFNVRKRKEDEWLDKEIKHYNLDKQSHSFYFQSYGRLSESEEYDKPIIVQNIANWHLYASDGTYFGQDLIARSEYEK